jgi:CAAX prenyl protease-like protein
MQGRGAGYDPFRAGPDVGLVLAGIRLFGAVAVVPIMEELFWRSFLLRYVISPRFQSVRLGTFTPLSFLLTVALFGVEHDLWLAGMVAGAAYSFLVYRTGQLWPSVLAHAVTNLGLGLEVLATGDWRWW